MIDVGVDHCTAHLHHCHPLQAYHRLLLVDPKTPVARVHNFGAMAHLIDAIISFADFLMTDDSPHRCV